jgi:hypothetical protein
MRVIATDKGFHNGARVKPGTVFSVPDGSKAKWFKPVESGEKVEKPARGKRSAPVEPDDSADLA